MKNRKKLGCREIAGRGGYMYSIFPTPKPFKGICPNLVCVPKKCLTLGLCF